MMSLPNAIVFAVLAGLALSCSDSGEDASIDRDTLSYKLKSIRNAAEFEENYKTALIGYYNKRLDQPVPVDVGGTAANEAEDVDSGNSSVSGTNLQELGVDEADRVKTDGQLLYVLNAPPAYTIAVDDVAETSLPTEPVVEQDTQSELGIFSLRSAEGDAEKLAALELTGLGIADGLFLHRTGPATRLAVTASSSGAYQPYWYDSSAWGGLSGSVTHVEVSDPYSPRVENSLKISGQIISTRRIGDHLLLASRFFPQIEGIHFWPESAAEKSANEARIRSLALTDLLPTYQYTSDTTERPLVAAEDCFVPESADALGYSVDVISLVSIDLKDLSLASSLCFVGATETFYASSQGIYLATSRYDWQFDDDGMADYAEPDVATDIHAFSVDNGQLSYAASGVVKGQLGWNVARRPFRLSEKDGFLRVVSFTAELEEDKSPVRLTVLARDGGELKTLASLPNERHPQPLGKPGEELYGSRFVGDRAYFVTFRVTDPLYVLDLSNPEQPFVAGELQIDGYSDYLHPLGETLLLGVGKDAIPDESGDQQRGAWYQGVKVSLIDVADPAAPAELQSVVIGKRGTESPVLRDHHAFTYLAGQAGGPDRFAIPLSVHDGAAAYEVDQSLPWAWHEWSHTGLHLFEIDINNRTLLPRGALKITTRESGNGMVSAEQDRSIVAGDSVFYIHGKRVYGALWETPEAINGPR
ncbi:MAG: beta-propeller domain-containing protein [Gammaproteobacteria bacterium]|nr:beta-propeller domain-containing protein [Gammaproteobacteria bacterium]